MDKKELIETVRNMIAASSCCPELKSVGQKYLDAVGTAAEKDAAAELLREAKEDVSNLEHTIGFFESPLGAQIFGAEQAKAMAAHARELKAQGGKWCDCPACSACVKIISNASLLA